MESEYQQAIKNGLSRPLAEEPSLREFKHWRIVQNRWPYDGEFRISHLILTKRVTPEPNLLEWIDYYFITKLLKKEGYYDVYLKNFKRSQSIKIHWHAHLLKYK